MARLRAPIAHQRSAWNWLLVLAALWTALASSWTHARGYGDGPPGMTVCTSAAALTVADLDPDLRDLHSQPDHCRFCLQTTDPQVPPPAPQFATSRERRGATVPWVWQAFSWSTPAYANATPRGPPLSH